MLANAELMSRSWGIALLLLQLGATVRYGKAGYASFDREDDDFAEFDFDLEEEVGEGERSSS